MLIHGRSAEIISQFKMGYSRCSVLDLIEFLPESTKVCAFFKYIFGQFKTLQSDQKD